MFLKSNSIIKEKHPEIIDRILFALGINNVVKNVLVNWEAYLKFNSYLKYFSATQKNYIKFWLLFFNPEGTHTIPRVIFSDTLEKLCRGNFTDDSTIISEKFSQGFYRLLVEKGCTENPEQSKD